MQPPWSIDLRLTIDVPGSQCLKRSNSPSLWRQAFILRSQPEEWKKLLLDLDAAKGQEASLIHCKNSIEKFVFILSKLNFISWPILNFLISVLLCVKLST